MPSVYQSVTYPTYQAIVDIFNVTITDVINQTTLKNSTINVDVAYVAYYYGLMVFFTLFSMITNTLVVVATVLTPNLRTVSNYYIIALAIVEILSAFFYTLYVFGSIQPSSVKYLGKYNYHIELFACFIFFHLTNVRKKLRSL